MKTGDVLLIYNSTVARLREVLKPFKLSIHPIKECTATGGRPAALVVGVPGEEYLSDIQALLVRHGITAQFFPLKEVVVLVAKEMAPDLDYLIKNFRAKELED
jgi:hypothetical protein